MVHTVDKVRTVIAAADTAALWTLRRHAGQEQALEIVAECLNGDSAVDAINRMEPDLLLLDLPKPTEDDFEALSRMDVEREPVVLMVAGEDGEAPAALDSSPSELLVKPFDRQRFHLAVRRVARRVYRRRGDMALLTAGPPYVSAASPPTPRHSDRILVKRDREIVVLPVTSIRWIESARNYLRLHAIDHTYVLRMPMNEIMTILDPSCFARVHRTAIVNMNCVHSFRHLASSSYLITLDDGTEVRMSRNYSRTVLSSYYLAGSQPEP